ncbi:MAG: S-methyl-5-thioribose-1-phosphate isomerase [Bacteroidetes bacterium]|nr:S-methyl-5-thioribose-1-phosphate isomerase [Bacteroidota bacterium]MBT4729596.1 S-methyl-5-thioribose-1-phosphate isomerase [Bacteroidota bacterium]
MNIANQYFEGIWLDNNKKVWVIDQRLLPFEFKTIELKNLEEAVFAISDMIVRGAPLIGVTAAFGMYLAAKEKQGINEAAKQLKASRPTAIDLAKSVNRILQKVKFEKNSSTEFILNEAKEIKLETLDQCKKIGEHGLKLIEDIYNSNEQKPVNILTHCNAGWLATVDYGTATAPIYLAHDKGIPVHVWVDETRPRNQGASLTAYELGQHGVPHTLIADNSGGHLMQHKMVDIVIVGTDRTTRQGDVANKIGTYLKALAAKDNHVPFYVAAPSSSIDFNMSDGLKEIPIEERDENEVKYMKGLSKGEIHEILICPDNTKAANYAFDVTPARLLSGLITERGICEANEKCILSLFPEFA